MANKLVSVVQTGTNNYLTPSLSFNRLSTDLISPGVIGQIFNTAGVAPCTGSYAVNAQGSPNMTVAVSAGTAYVSATPTSGTAQTFAVTMDASENATIAANSTGGTRYDFIYLKLDADNLNNPSSTALNVATLVVQRSTTQYVDSNTAPANSLLLAEVTVANGASSIANASIADRRSDASFLEYTGWRNANETWTYASATTFTVPSTAAARKFSVGDKVKLFQSGWKYFYVTGVSSTTVTINGGSSYTLANAAIQYPHVSKAETPLDFPQWFSWTPTLSGRFTDGDWTKDCKFQQVGKIVFFRLSLTATDATPMAGASGQATFTLPVASTALTANRATIADGFLVDASGATYPAMTFWTATTTIDIYTGGTTAAAITSAAPFTWTTSDVIWIQGFYEAA